MTRPLRFDPVEEAVSNWTREGWGDAADGMALVTSVMRAHQILLADVDAVLAPMDLTFSRYEALMLLHFSRTGALPLGKIGERLQVHAASVTNCINRLEADGLVARRPHPTDGRTTLAQISRKGRARALRATDALNEIVFTRVTGDHTRRAVAALRVLRKNAGDFT